LPFQSRLQFFKWASLFPEAITKPIRRAISRPIDSPERSVDSPEQRVTLVDDAEGALGLYRSEDLRRIEQYSDVVLFSERARVRYTLAA
jgi:hypothetical protein